MVIWPISPAAPEKPWSSLPLMMMPPPMPVPGKMPTASSQALISSLKRHSPYVPILTSLSTAAGVLKCFDSTSAKGKFFHPRLGVSMIVPVLGSSGPGEPTPMPLSLGLPASSMASSITRMMRVSTGSSPFRVLLFLRQRPTASNLWLYTTAIIFVPPISRPMTCSPGRSSFSMAFLP